jgi:hypothetical protein
LAPEFGKSDVEPAQASEKIDETEASVGLIHRFPFRR